MTVNDIAHIIVEGESINTLYLKDGRIEKAVSVVERGVDRAGRRELVGVQRPLARASLHQRSLGLIAHA